MKRVVFITDQHVCAASRWEETLRVMDWCASKFEELKPDAIALGGDLFDRRPDVNELRTVAAWLVRLARIAPVVAVSGNHDPLGLNVFNLLESDHPIYFTDMPEVVQAGGVEFVLLPWPRKARLLAALGDVGMEEARQVGMELLTNVLRGLGTSQQPEVARCFVGHVQLRGAKVSTGQPMAPGADFELGTEDLALASCDAYLLGHIHLPDDADVNGAPVSYGGSFRRTAYGELEEKSIVVLDFDPSVAGADVTRSRVTIPCTPMVHLDAVWTDEGFVGASELISDAESGADVRFRYRVDADKRDAALAAAEAFRDELLERGAVAVKLDPQVIPTTTARAPEVAKATTLEGKLRAMWAARGTTPDESRSARLLSNATLLEESSHEV